MPYDNRHQNNQFALSFETRNAAGLIRYTKVTIEEALMDMDDRVWINLCEHPLYKSLEQYVLSNPSRTL